MIYFLSLKEKFDFLNIISLITTNQANNPNQTNKPNQTNTTNQRQLVIHNEHSTTPHRKECKLGMYDHDADTYTRRKGQDPERDHETSIL